MLELLDVRRAERPGDLQTEWQGEEAEGATEGVLDEGTTGQLGRLGALGDRGDGLGPLSGRRRLLVPLLDDLGVRHQGLGPVHGTEADHEDGDAERDTEHDVLGARDADAGEVEGRVVRHDEVGDEEDERASMERPNIVAT